MPSWLVVLGFAVAFGALPTGTWAAPWDPAAPVSQATPRSDAIDVDRATSVLESLAFEHTRGLCAKHVQRALEAAGIDGAGHPVGAKDYGPYLLARGFKALSGDAYQPRTGDVVVIQPRAGTPGAGHIAMFDGARWIWDYRQSTFWGSRPRPSQDAVVFYRSAPGRGGCGEPGLPAAGASWRFEREWTERPSTKGGHLLDPHGNPNPRLTDSGTAGRTEPAATFTDSGPFPANCVGKLAYAIKGLADALTPEADLEFTGTLVGTGTSGANSPCSYMAWAKMAGRPLGGTPVASALGKAVSVKGEVVRVPRASADRLADGSPPTMEIIVVLSGGNAERSIGLHRVYRWVPLAGPR